MKTKTMTAIEIAQPHSGWYDCYYRKEWLNENVKSYNINLIHRDKLHEFAYLRGFTHIKIDNVDQPIKTVKVNAR